MKTSLSAAAASLGSSSQMWTPGIFVAIGLNSPRISLGASGLRSIMSMVRRPAVEMDVDHGLVRRADPRRRLGPQQARQRQSAADGPRRQQLASREARAAQASARRRRAWRISRWGQRRGQIGATDGRGSDCIGSAATYKQFPKMIYIAHPSNGLDRQPDVRLTSPAT